MRAGGEQVDFLTLLIVKVPIFIQNRWGSYNLATFNFSNDRSAKKVQAFDASLVID